MNTNARFEFKYVIDGRKARQIQLFIDKIGLRKDGPGNGHYTVCSLYFDTPGLKDYYEKQAGLKQRRKLRARVYGDEFSENAGKIWLENKEKDDMFVSKKRQLILPEEWRLFSSGGERFDARRLAKKSGEPADFLYHFLGGNYKPHVVVLYERRAYIGDFFGPFRLTLDSNIRACKWRDFRYNKNAVSVAKNKVVLEVKFSSAMPWWLKDMIHRFDLRRQAFSKYTNAVDAISRFNKIER